MHRLLALLLLLPALCFAQKPDILEVLSIQGEINSGTAEMIASEVEKINDNAKVKAVLLIVNTPGGSVTASSAIYEDLARLKVPVVVWCMSMCASGGMYIAMSPAVKAIYVRSETIAGSIGVVMQSIKFHRLLDFLKVDPKTYRSGHLKDAGNPTRALEEAEDKYLQSIVDSLADKFYQIVAKARPKITPDGWREIKTAKILIGHEAVRAGLVDAIGSRKDAEAKAKALSGSKTIFTREELKKMSSAAEGHSSYETPKREPSLYGDIPALVEIVKEIRAGEAVTFSYRMRERF